MVHRASETPDVIGWHSGFTTLIECKISRTDFKADAKKFFRAQPEMGIGYYRYYLAPKGLIDADELPDQWGLIEVKNGKTKVKVPSEPWYESNLRGEVSMLLSLIRRLKVEPGRHVKIKAYVIDDGSDCKATVTLRQKERHE
jgi:hypothetical protein